MIHNIASEAGAVILVVYIFLWMDGWLMSKMEAKIPHYVTLRYVMYLQQTNNNTTIPFPSDPSIAKPLLLLPAKKISIYGLTKIILTIFLRHDISLAQDKPDFVAGGGGGGGGGGGSGELVWDAIYHSAWILTAHMDGPYSTTTSSSIFAWSGSFVLGSGTVDHSLRAPKCGFERMNGEKDDRIGINQHSSIKNLIKNLNNTHHTCRGFSPLPFSSPTA